MKGRLKCVDSERSDNDVIDEQPVIPEATYDGDREESEYDEDSIKSSQVEIGSVKGSEIPKPELPDIPEEEIEPQPVQPPVQPTGSPLTKDTSMDGERMTVSDSDATVMDDADRIAQIKKIQLPDRNSEISGIESPIPNFHLPYKPPSEPKLDNLQKEPEIEAPVQIEPELEMDSCDNNQPEVSKEIENEPEIPAEKSENLPPLKESEPEAHPEMPKPEEIEIEKSETQSDIPKELAEESNVEKNEEKSAESPIPDFGVSIKKTSRTRKTSGRKVGRPRKRQVSEPLPKTEVAEEVTNRIDASNSPESPIPDFGPRIEKAPTENGDLFDLEKLLTELEGEVSDTTLRLAHLNYLGKKAPPLTRTTRSTFFYSIYTGIAMRMKIQKSWGMSCPKK